MCGIVGYTGPGPAVEFVLKGLTQLEYRGYDSAGFAALENGRLELVRTVGRVADLRRKAGARAWQARTAIGHTRWATHGRVAEKNAHPHLDHTGLLALVHNGILENYEALRRELTAQGRPFRS
jgi:glucosamine--fructose-6-phosphate aminotransferase (isomerizing)